MTIADQIDFDAECLKTYFERLLVLADELSEIRPPVPDPNEVANNYNAELAKQFVADSVAAFIRPDMACNVYNFVDFYLGQLCAYHRNRKGLALAHKDIRGHNELDAYDKYLTKVALLDLTAVTANLQGLHDLRKVRNFVTHSGAHVANDNHGLANINGVTVCGTLIVISDAFIWNALDHARKYLSAVGRA